MNTPPVLPVGLSTKLGLVVGSALAVISGITAVLNGDHSEMTVLTLVLSAVTFIFLIGGRQVQAALTNWAFYRDAPPEIER